MIKNENHIYGMDWIRAFMSVAVVVLHMGGAGFSLIYDKNKFREHNFVFSDLVNFHVLYLAVPTFILLSCFLFAQKTPDYKYLKKRLSKLFLIITFWPIALTIWHNNFYVFIAKLPKNFINQCFYILTAGDTVYYFFICLIILITITFIASKISTKSNIFFLITTSILLILLPKITIKTEWFLLSAFWNPMNFMPYPFAATLLTRPANILHNKLLLQITILFMIILGIFFSCFEWYFFKDAIFFRTHAHAFPAYTRISLLIFSTVLIIISYNYKFPRNKIILFMSKHSLALYCLHPFFRLIRYSDVKAINVICVIMISYTLSLCLPKYLRRELIR